MANKKTYETVSDVADMSDFSGLVPTSLDFVGATNVFELGSLLKVSSGMAVLELCPRGVMLISKNTLTDGCQLVPWAGIKSLRLNTVAWVKEKAESLA